MRRFLSCCAIPLLVFAADLNGQAVDERLRVLEARVDSLMAAAETADAAQVAELRERLDAVLRELERIQVDEAEAVPLEGTLGFAPSASKVYGVRRGVSIGGYGEVLYENFSSEREDGSPSGARDQIDALRAIIYLGYRFSDRLLFNSEIEFEHGSTGQAGSASVEFAYLDFLLGERAGIRAGVVLVPMGFTNELHEPTTFLPTERPETERRIIPSTWRENGVGAFADVGDFSLRGYLVNGFDAVGGGPSNAGGFSSSGLRGGRQKASKALAESVAAVGRIDWEGIPGVMLGASVYAGDSGQGAAAATDPEATVGAFTTIVEGHGQYRANGLDLRGLFALADVDDVAELNALRGLDGASSIGERLTGGYVQVGYDVLRGLDSGVEVSPFFRFERLDTQSRVPEGFSANPATDRSILTFGVAWRPAYGAIVKADYQIHSNDADTGVNQFNLALGYAF